MCNLNYFIIQIEIASQFSIFIMNKFELSTFITYKRICFANSFESQISVESFGGLKWNRTIDLTLIRRAL